MSMDEDFKALIKKGEEQLSYLKDVHLAEIKEIKKEHDAEVYRLRYSLYDSFQSELEQLKESSKSEMEKIKNRSTTLVTSILAVVVTGIVAFLYTSTNDIFSNTATVNQSVITLQSSLLSAQQSISKAQSDLQAAKDRGANLIKESMVDLSNAKTELENARSKLVIAKDNLAETKGIYDSRLTELKVKQIEK